jgi:protein kinase-like protein
MPLAPSTKLGPYEIQSLLGTGGMGEVYRAKDTRLDRTVAMKILPAHLSSDPVRKQRFEREAKIISSLNHPNICVLYDVGQDRGGLTIPVAPWAGGAWNQDGVIVFGSPIGLFRVPVSGGVPVQITAADPFAWSQSPFPAYDPPP